MQKNSRPQKSTYCSSFSSFRPLWSRPLLHLSVLSCSIPSSPIAIICSSVIYFENAFSRVTSRLFSIGLDGIFPACRSIVPTLPLSNKLVEEPQIRRISRARCRPTVHFKSFYIPGTNPIQFCAAVALNGRLLVTFTLRHVSTHN